MSARTPRIADEFRQLLYASSLPVLESTIQLLANALTADNCRTPGCRVSPLSKQSSVFLDPREDAAKCGRPAHARDQDLRVPVTALEPGAQRTAGFGFEGLARPEAILGTWRDGAEVVRRDAAHVLDDEPELLAIGQTCDRAPVPQELVDVVVVAAEPGVGRRVLLGPCGCEVVEGRALLDQRPPGVEHPQIERREVLVVALRDLESLPDERRDLAQFRRLRSTREPRLEQDLARPDAGVQACRVLGRDVADRVAPAGGDAVARRP